MAGRNLPIYVWPAEKKRLTEMQRRMEDELDRPIVMAEVIRTMIAELDKAREANQA